MSHDALCVSACEPAELVRDANRLSALYKTQLLDTPAEEGFDRLTTMAARLLDVPMAFISLVDDQRAFVKSHYGLPKPLANDWAHPSYVMGQCVLAKGGPLIIDDAAQHPVAASLSKFLPAMGAFLGVPLKDDSGELLGYFAVADYRPRLWYPRDLDLLSELTHSATREIRLRLAVQEVQQHARCARIAVRAREELLAVVAHDLRTPLSVLTMAFSLFDGIILNERQREVVNHAQKASGHMGKLIDELLEISQMEQSQLELRLSQLDPHKLLEDAVAMLQPLAERSGIRLLTSCEQALPVIKGDYERLLRVFSNLVSNAVKFSLPGSTVWVSVVRDSQGVRFTVSDNGPGIAESDLPFIFDRYWQVKKREHQGVGLGLAIVKTIVEAHGGTIRVSSTLGEGSDFCFHLPLA
ncbi:sensor histidine kinase [Pseudomonas asuensis]|uniref:histidine kinase n=1 Tax=Pseudomonas asuensis TaxID=1825787 RepID=A0ABQ2GZ57_9PSED|nr:GAF domain-containing sensor histidine kinase [Pseudomonas asuensis]GGM21034.1 hypothetical protein GCM10009425_34990 [Pseudomonas asuensis]